MPAFPLYAPNYRMPTEKVYPEVLIHSWFPGDETSPSGYGSGFFIGPWRACLLTAAHVVYEGAKRPATKLRIRVKLAGGGYRYLYAKAFAVHHPNRYDVAVVRLQWRRPGLVRAMPVASHPTNGEFQAKLSYYQKGIGPVQDKTSAEWIDPRLVYSPDLDTHGGMSGGALLYKNYAIGVHRGERDFDGRARGIATPFVAENITRMENDARDMVAGG